jgi:hypothetical protein
VTVQTLFAQAAPVLVIFFMAINTLSWSLAILLARPMATDTFDGNVFTLERKISSCVIEHLLVQVQNIGITPPVFRVAGLTTLVL